MTYKEFFDGELSFTVDNFDTSLMRIVSCPPGQHATTYCLDRDKVLSLISSLQSMAEEMEARSVAMKTAEEMAKDLHDKGWTFKRFSDAMHPRGSVPTLTVLNDIADELARLDMEGME